MQKAIHLSIDNVTKCKGAPFRAVVVKNGKKVPLKKAFEKK